MARLPFNPDLIPSRTPSAAPRRGDAETPMSVGQLAGRIKDALAAGLPAKVRVIGEVSNFSDRAHWFFSLKDDAATVRCVCFASSARRVPCPVGDGMQVVVTGRIDFYDAQGNVQLYVDRIEPAGQGALEQRLRQLMEELRGQGYFDPIRKKPLPMAPCRVAVVTSRSGAALQDVIHTAAKRWAGCQLYLYDVRVQGAQAAPEIADAIRALSRSGAKLGIEAIILTRGGGSIEDLWAFNERVVADAIFECPLPIVAAIGHETDTTIAELVADVRCATPTQAAMHLVADRAVLEQQVDQAARRLTLLVGRQIEHARHRLGAAARHALFRRPGRLVEAARQRLEAAEKRLRLALPRVLTPARRRLESSQARLVAALPRRVAPARDRLVSGAGALRAAMPRRLREARSRLVGLTRQLEAVNPGNVLERGYSYTLDAEGHVLRRAGDAQRGQRLTTVLADGRIVSVVQGEAESPSAESPAATTRAPRAQAGKASSGPRPRGRRAAKIDPDQSSLFG